MQQGVQQEEVGHVRELFSLCDKNGDGSIDMVRTDESVSPCHCLTKLSLADPGLLVQDELNAVFVELGALSTQSYRGLVYR